MSLTSNNSARLQIRTFPNPSGDTGRWRARTVYCSLMSGVRRTFCLSVTFDLILTFVLWGIFVQLKETTGNNSTSAACNMSEGRAYNYCDEVWNFSMTSSLFDIAICGILRFLLLVFAYGLFRLQNSSVVAVTTFFTSLYVFMKVFVFQKYRQNPLSYLLLICSLIVAWLEAWFLDLQVLPKERASLHQLTEAGGYGSEQRESLLVVSSTPEHIDSDVGTPVEESENDDERSRPTEIKGPNISTNSEYRRKADDAWTVAWQLFNLQDGWECEASFEDIIVHSQEFSNHGKIFKVEATINASVNDVFKMTTICCSKIPSWNPTILECRILESLGQSMDILYSVTAPAGGGMVSSRDFVTARRWKRTETGEILAAGVAVDHHLMPVQTQHVRGENRVLGWLFQAVPNNPNQCLLRMVAGTDIKGWIPQMVVDQALTGVLVDSIQYLRSYISHS